LKYGTLSDSFEDHAPSSAILVELAIRTLPIIDYGTLFHGQTKAQVDSSGFVIADSCEYSLGSKTDNNHLGLFRRGLK
jgi:hypothetical protein